MGVANPLSRFDKSFNLIVARNARVGFNAEHSWADAPIMAHLWEFCLHYDFHVLEYDAQGNCRVGGVSPEATNQTPIRLKWEFNSDLEREISHAFKQGETCCS